MSDELKLLKCGCGGEAKAWDFMNGRWYVKCQKCGIGQFFAYRSEAEAIKAWNRAMSERKSKVKWASTYGEIMEYRFDGICGCGTEVDKMWEYCPSCGARLE